MPTDTTISPREVEAIALLRECAQRLERSVNDNEEMQRRMDEMTAKVDAWDALQLYALTKRSTPDETATIDELWRIAQDAAKNVATRQAQHPA